MILTKPSSLSDRELLTETRRLAESERRTTAALISLLAEVDARRLYLGEGYSSLFAYCTRALRLSEQAAYARIEPARAVRQFPVILSHLSEGSLTLTTVGLLAPHLTEDNCEHLLDAARRQSKREVERLVAAIHAQPDIPPSIRQLPTLSAVPKSGVVDTQSTGFLEEVTASTVRPAEVTPSPAQTLPARAPAGHQVVAPISTRRYLIRVTVGEETQRKLEQARDLLRHQIPDGDLAKVFDRALTVLLDHAERAKFAAVKQPPGARRVTPAARPSTGATGGSRRIPAEVRRTVWDRDGGRCAFVGADGRCTETGLVEFHHVVPFSTGGRSTVENLQLRCRAHNAYEADVAGIGWRPLAETRSGPSLKGGEASGRPLPG